MFCVYWLIFTVSVTISHGALLPPFAMAALMAWGSELLTSGTFWSLWQGFKCPWGVDNIKIVLCSSALWKNLALTLGDVSSFSRHKHAYLKFPLCPVSAEPPDFMTGKGEQRKRATNLDYWFHLSV